jgi:hypothetical protein
MMPKITYEIIARTMNHVIYISTFYWYNSHGHDKVNYQLIDEFKRSIYGNLETNNYLQCQSLVFVLHLDFTRIILSIDISK